MCTIGSCIKTIGPQLVALFIEVMEHLGGRTLLKQVDQYWWHLRVYILAVHPLLCMGKEGYDLAAFCFYCHAMLTPT